MTLTILAKLRQALRGLSAWAAHLVKHRPIGLLPASDGVTSDVGQGGSQWLSGATRNLSRLAIVLVAFLLEVARVGILAFPEKLIDVLLAVGVLTTATTHLPHSRWLLLLFFLLAFGQSVGAVYPVAALSERREFPVVAGISIALAVVALWASGVVTFLAVGLNLAVLYLYVRRFRDAAAGRIVLTYVLLSTLLGVAFVVINKFTYIVLAFLALWVVWMSLRMSNRVEKHLDALNLEATLQALGETFNTRVGVVFSVLVYAQLQQTALIYSPEAARRSVEHLDAVQWFLLHSEIRDAGFYAYLLLVGLYGLTVFGFVALNLSFWGRTAVAGHRLLTKESASEAETKMPPWQQILLILAVGGVGVVPQIIRSRISTTFDPESAARVAFAPIVAIAASEMYGVLLLLTLLIAILLPVAIAIGWRRWKPPSEVQFAHAATVSFLIYTTVLLVLIYHGILPLEAVDFHLTALDVALLYPLIALFYFTARHPENHGWLPLVGATGSVGILIVIGVWTRSLTFSGTFLLVGLCLAVQWIGELEAVGLLTKPR